MVRSRVCAGDWRRDPHRAAAGHPAAPNGPRAAVGSAGPGAATRWCRRCSGGAAGRRSPSRRRARCPGRSWWLLLVGDRWSTRLLVSLTLSRWCEPTLRLMVRSTFTVVTRDTSGRGLRSPGARWRTSSTWPPGGPDPGLPGGDHGGGRAGRRHRPVRDHRPLGRGAGAGLGAGSVAAGGAGGHARDRGAVPGHHGGAADAGGAGAGPTARARSGAVRLHRRLAGQHRLADPAGVQPDQPARVRAAAAHRGGVHAADVGTGPGGLAGDGRAARRWCSDDDCTAVTRCRSRSRSRTGRCSSWPASSAPDSVRRSCSGWTSRWPR